MKLFFTLSFTFLCFISIGQYTPTSGTGTSADEQRSWVELMQDPTVNFYEVQRAFYDYWKGKKQVKGQGYKAFKRWEAYMAPRVYPTGERSQAAMNYENFLKWEKQNPSSSNKSLSGNWTALGPTGAPTGGLWGTKGGAGRLNFVRVDPSNSSIIYVGSPDGGLWKTINGGSTWSTNTDNLTVIGCTDIAINPTNTQIMYLATGDGDGSDSYSVGVLKSTDGGTTWNTTGLNWTVTQLRTISKLLIDPNNPAVLLAATSAGIYKTSDSGATWTQERTGSFKDIEFKPGDPNTVYAVGTSFVKSTDNGNNWTSITNGLPSSGTVSRISMAVTAANSAYVYLLVSNDTDYGLEGIYRSTDSGTSFTQRDNGGINLLNSQSDGSGSGGQGWYDLTIAASPSNAQEIVVGGINVWKSTDGGAGWNIISHWYGDNAPYIHADQHDLYYQGTTLFAANDGGLFKTTNGGVSWTDISSNIVIAQQYRISTSTSTANFIIAGHQDNGTNILSGSTWTYRKGGDGMDCIIDRTNNSILYGSSQYGGHERSDDGGVNWTDINSSLPTGAWISTLRQDPVTANTIYAGGRTQLYKSTNKGDSWSTLGTPSGSGDILEFSIAPSNNQIIYAIKDGAVSKSTNGGSSWTNVSTGLPVSSLQATYVAISNTDPNIAWVTFSGYTASSKVYKTTNGGSSWTNTTTGLPNIPCNTIVYDNSSSDQSIYVGTDVGVYYMNNTMGSWTIFSTGLPRVAVRDLEIFYSGSKLRAATFGRGTWESDLYTVSAAPPVADFSGTPTTLFAGQNVTFTNLSTQNPTSYSWSFTGGSPTSSTATNPVITYNTPGTYAVSLTATNAAGSDIETKTAYITVNAIPLPVANFSGTPTTLFAGQTVAFTNLSTQNPTAYSWSFTGGTPTSSTVTNPVITYNTPGTYSVSLTATNASGSDIETKTAYITVNAVALPVADFTASATEICPTQQVTFTNTSTGSPTSYSWSFPGGTPSSSTAANPVITYSTAGTYSVTLTATNAGGSDMETKTNLIVVGSGVGASLPFTEGFTGGVFPPSASWTNINAGGLGNWNVSTTIGNTPTAGNSLFFDNFNNNDIGFNDEIRLPGLDLRNLGTVSLTFDVAYAQYSATDSDGLEILISSDCGQTFTSVFAKSGSALATAPDITSLFEPTSGQWRNETVDLSPYIGQSNVILSIKNIADYGNVMYIDNINISGLTGAPTANFTANATNVCAGQSITYTSTSTGTVTNYNWSFPGGTPSTSTSPNPTVIYSTAGNYNVQLTASNGGGSDVELKSSFVTINAVPATPSISASGATTFCSGSSVVLTSSAAASYLWSTGAVSQSITVNTSGTYSVSAIQGICSAISSATTVTVNTVPVISLGSVVAVSNCTTPNGSVQVNGSGTGTLSWSGAATGSVAGATLPYTISNLAPGSYQILFTSTCVSNQITATVSANTPATPSITADGPMVFCQGGSVTLTSSASSNNVWSTGATTTSITVNSSGTYSVVVSELGCESLAAESTVQVNPIPVISAGTVSNPSNCGAADGFIQVNGSGAGSISWDGTSSSGSTSIVLPGNISNLQAGTYTINFDNGCPSNTISVSVTDPGAPPTPVITASGSTTFCEGESVVLTSSAASSNVWSTGETSTSITVTNAGSYSVMTSIGACFSSSLTTTIVVNPLPIVGLTALAPVCINSGTLVLSGGTPSGGTYSGIGVSGNQFNPLVADTGIHQITYSVTDVNGCTANASQDIYVDPCAAVGEINGNSFIIYPNPANGELYIISSANTIDKIEIIDELGKTVMTQTVLSEKTMIDVSALAAGSYQIRISNESGISHHRIQLIH